MSSIQDSATLNSVLGKVGLRIGEPLAIDRGAVASTWVSDYAELYIVDPGAVGVAEMPEFLKRIDSVVAKRLRDQRDAGKSIDAHVCIMVSNEVIKSDKLTKESDASRYVSRKYWIDRMSPVEEILRRLTLTWVDVQAMARGAAPFFSEDFSDLRERIGRRMGSGAAADFLEAKTE